MKTPITILTGFLGSGKSTLLSQILKDDEFSNAAVIVNEFGEVGLDDFLVTHSDEQVMEMTTGCLCCTIRGDISNTLFDLWTKRKTGELPKFERIIVETTGLADPAPVIQTIMTDPRIFSRFSLNGIITTVDAVNGMTTLDQQVECIKQVAVSDRIVITKSDLDIKRTLFDDLKNYLSQLNPTANILEKHSDAFNLKNLFDTALFDEKNKTADVQKWLNLENFSNHHDDHHHHHHHDVNKHGEHIETFSVIIKEPVSTQLFIQAIQSLILTHGKDLLRIKGIANLSERPNKPYIFHGVQHIFHEPIELPEWPDEDKRTKIVFITRNISRSIIDNYFSSWLT